MDNNILKTSECAVIGIAAFAVISNVLFPPNLALYGLSVIVYVIYESTVRRLSRFTPDATEEVQMRNSVLWYLRAFRWVFVGVLLITIFRIGVL